MDRFSCNVSSNPSFSSTLLDAIYRSIDEGEDELVVYRETMRKKQQSRIGFKDEEEMANFQRLRMIEKWMEKESEKVVVRRRSLADFVPNARNRETPEVFYSNSSWSSSDSSSGGGFSSSEAEAEAEVEDSVFAVPRNRATSTTSCYGLQKPKPVKTKVVSSQQQKPKHEGGFEKTKSKALKIYGDLKKAKQPISPGGKLATFLNSLFNGHEKKAERERKSKSANASTCSSASSFSKSCLSKTPSSRGKLLSNGAKRSVRFYPVSVIVNEDCQPCGHKSLHEEKPKMGGMKDARTTLNEELKIYNLEKNWQVGEAAKDLLRNYQKRVELEFDLRSSNQDKNQIFSNEAEEEDEEEFDAVSCCSSDLFELDNLSAIGMERYREELPVYETTHFDTNRAIANGIIL